MFSLTHRWMKHLMPVWLYQKMIGDFNSVGLQKYFKNTGWIFGARIAMMGISFIATLYIARHLGPTNFGELSYAISFVSLFSFIAILGLDSVLYRELAAHPEKKNELLGSAIRLRVIAAVSAALLCLVSASFFSSDDVSFVLIAILVCTFLFQTTFIIHFEFQAAVYAKSVSLLAVAVTFIINSAKLLVVYFDQGVIFLAGVLLAEAILLAGGYIYLRTKTFGSLRTWKYDNTVAKSLLRDSWPLMFSSAFVLIYARIDQIMLKNMLDATAVGIYDAAVRLSELWYFIPTVIISSLFPALVNARKHSSTEYQLRILRLFSLLMLLSLCITIPVFLLADPIVALVFGNSFVGTAAVLQLYIWALLPVAAITLFNQILLAENATKTMLLASLIGMFINVAGNFWLIPHFGVNGAAIATILSSSMLFIFMVLIYGIIRYKTTSTYAK